MKRLVAVVAGAALIAACSQTPVIDDHDEHMDTAPTATTLTVSLTEFAIDIDGDVEEGETYTFIVTNDGVAPHEFEVTGDEAIDGHLDGGHDGHGDMVMGDKLILEPGETGELTATITDEANVAACLIPGHYEAGMFTELTDGHGDH